MYNCRTGGPGTQPPDDQAAHHRGTSHRRKRGGNLRDHRPDDLLRRDARRGERFPHRQGDVRRAGGPRFDRLATSRKAASGYTQRLRAPISPGERRRLWPGGPGRRHSPAPASQRRRTRCRGYPPATPERKGGTRRLRTTSTRSPTGRHSSRTASIRSLTGRQERAG